MRVEVVDMVVLEVQMVAEPVVLASAELVELKANSQHQQFLQQVQAEVVVAALDITLVVLVAEV